MSLVTQPSWQNGYARSPGESDAPEHWQGLVGAWTPALGVQGLLVYDLMGLVSQGTFENMEGADWGVCPYGACVSLGGTDERIRFGLVLPNIYPVTHSLLIRPSSLATAVYTIARRSTTTGYWQISLTTSGAVEFLRRATSGNVLRSTNTGLITTNVWAHVAVTWNGGLAQTGIHIYVNGVEATYASGEDGSTSVASDASNELVFGYRQNGNSNYFVGDVADLRMWNYAWDPAAIGVLARDPLAMYRLRRRVWAMAPSGQAFVLTAEAGAYSLSGQAAALELGRLMAAQEGTYALSGQESSLEFGRAVVPQAGAYTLTGQDLSLQKGRRLTLESGASAVTGQDVALLAARVLIPQAGSYSLTGQDLSLHKGRTLTLAVGSYTLSGQVMTLVATRQIIPQAGSYPLDGQSLSLERGYPLTIQAGSYTLTGQEVTLLATRLLIPQAGTYSLTGQDVELIYQAVGAYLLQAEAGSYVLSGQAVTLLSGRVLAAQAGSYVLTGDDLTLELVRLLRLEAGAYVLTGDDVELLLGRRLAITPGAYVLVGLPQTLSYSEEAPVSGGLTLMGSRVRRLRLLGILEGDPPEEGWVRHSSMRPWWLRGKG